MSSCVLMLLLAAGAAPDRPILENGDFETAAAARVGADGLSNGWRLGRPPQVPAAWTLNSAYPGELAVCRSAPTESAHSGQHFVRITAAERDGHLYQMCKGLEPGKWYRVSAWVRGGVVALEFYEYFHSGKTSGQSVGEATEAGAGWRLLSGFYRTPGDGYLRSALAVCVHPRQSVDVDDVSIEPLVLPRLAADAADISLETDLVRLRVSPQGILREFRSKPSGKDYAAQGVPFPILRMIRRGVPVPMHSVARQGDLLRVQFLDPELGATLRVSGGKRHLLLEVVDVRPADAEELILEIPLARLKTIAGAMNATYDEQFGACVWGCTVNTRQQLIPHGHDAVGLSVGCGGGHGIVGARFVLAAAPRDQLQVAMMEAERGGGLPCPMLDGRWARDSQPVRRSYLFVVDAREDNIDKLIEYAKIGHFGTIIFLKSNWLSTHGHYQINMRNFPGGVASLKRAVEKIHAAGMGAGVHVFGPSISPGDPYVTPKPDDRLACVRCPPLAAAVDAKSATLALAGQPKLPPYAPRSDAFPGFYLRIGDEIVRYRDLEWGPPPRFVRCQRGALGTKAAPHPAGSPVKGLLTLWGYFIVDPDSTLADELTGNFAAVFNACDFDMAYFDASDGISDAYLDRRYYLNKLHLGFYRKLKKDVLYQTGNGTGTDLVWHIVPRSASADGHGDLKRYLDERLPGMAGMADNWTHADVGWYYMYDKVRPDQIEYVCAKTIGLDGSISIETSQAAMEKHPRARQMLEMAGRYEQCRLANFFPESVRAQLREPGQDFKLFGDGPSWRLMRAVYEEPRLVESLDGEQNAWTIRNDQAFPCPLGVEIARGFRNVRTAVKAGLGGLRALPRLQPAPPLVQPTVTVNGRPVVLPVRLQCGQALTSEGPGGVHFWPGGMQPGQTLDVATAALMLAPGENRITFTADTREGYPDDVNVLLYRLHPLP